MWTDDEIFREAIAVIVEQLVEEELSELFCHAKIEGFRWPRGRIHRRLPFDEGVEFDQIVREGNERVQCANLRIERKPWSTTNREEKQSKLPSDPEC